MFGIQGLAQGLDDRFALLTKGRRTALRRQQTLRATMDWSHDLLPSIERIVLRRLGVFRGDFTMEAACAVVGDDQVSGVEVVASVANLATKSLVTTDISGDVTYHRLLDTTRAYALEKLAESPDSGSLGRRHAEYYRDFFAPAEGERRWRPQAEWLAIYGRHIDNVRAGLDWAFSAQRRSADRRGADRCRTAAVDAALAAGRMPRAGRTRARQPWRRRGRDRTPAHAAFRGTWLVADVRRGSGAAVRRRMGDDPGTRGRLDDTDYRRRALWGLCIDQFNNGNVRTALGFARASPI